MPFIFNPFTSNLDRTNKASPEVVSSDPATGSLGQLIYNSTEFKIKTYLGGIWVILHDLSEIVLFDESGNALTDEAGLALLSTNDMQYLRS